MKKVIRKKLWFLVLGLFLFSMSQGVNAQSDITSEAIQEIATAYDLTIYASGTFSSNAAIDVLTAEGEIATSKAQIAYYEAVSSDIQLNGRAPEEALILNLQSVGEYETSSVAIKALYDNTVVMLQ